MGFIVDYQDIDITDKTILQEQLNYFRNNWNDAVRQLDSIGKDIINLNRQLNQRKSVVKKNNIGKSIGPLLEDDEEYMELKWKLEAYRLSEKIIQENINMLQTDVNILRGSMYSKF